MDILTHPKPTVKPVNFQRQHAGQALRELRATTAPDSRERNALNRAALDVEANTWLFADGMLSIDSATGDRVYHVDAGGCDCRAALAGRTCRHWWCYAIITRAEQIANPSPYLDLARNDPEAFSRLTDELFA